MTAGRPLSIENHLDVERPLSVARHGARNRGATVEIVIPVYDEAATLEAGVRRLRAYLDDRLPFDTIVTVADNASTDGTWGVAARLAAQVPGVRAVHLDQPRAGPSPARGLVDQPGRRGGLHGRRPFHRARRHPAAGGATDLRPQRRRHRQPPGPRGARRRPNRREPRGCAAPDARPGSAVRCRRTSRRPRRGGGGGGPAKTTKAGLTVGQTLQIRGKEVNNTTLAASSIAQGRPAFGRFGGGGGGGGGGLPPDA